jgi:cytoskeletal protein CcmA (bactofilin family)
VWFSSRRKPPTIRSLVGEGTVVTGELRYADGIRIDGEVHGDVIAAAPGDPNLLVIGEKARVLGTVKGGHVIVNGEVHGPIEAVELLELQPQARIFGDVRYEALEMHQGASISGELRPIEPPARGEMPAEEAGADDKG